MTVERLSQNELSEAAVAGLLNADEINARHIAIEGHFSMSNMDMVTLLRALGANFEWSPRRGCEYLIVGRDASQEVLDVAQANGLKLVSETEFVDMITPRT